MFEQFSLGIYYPADSPLHRLRAWTKLIILVWLAVFTAVANRRMWHAAPYFALAALALAAAALSGVGLGYVWRRMRLLALVTLLGAVFTALLLADEGAPLITLGPAAIPFAAVYLAVVTGCAALAALLGLALLGVPAARRLRRRWPLRGAPVPVSFTLMAAGMLWLLRGAVGQSFAVGPLVITDESAWIAARLWAVFLSLYALALLLTLTTTPVALIEGLTLLLAPLRRLRLPVDEFALMALLALRFFPTLAEEIELLVKAQVARGVDFTHGSLQERSESLAALVVPVFQGAMRRATALAAALDARGYWPGARHTLLHEGPLATRDYLALAVVGLLTIGALLI